MEILQSSLYAVAIGLSLFCVLLAQHGKADVKVRFFTAFLVIQTMRFVCEWLMIHPEMPFTMFWLFGVMALSLLVSPLAWAFAKDLSHNTYPFAIRKLLPHAVVILVGVLLLVPLFATLFNSSPFTQLTWPGAPQYALVHVTMLLMVGVFLLQSAYYIRECIILFYQRIEQNKGLFAQVSDLGSNTLRILVVAVIANCIVSVLRVLYCWALDEEALLNTLFAGLQVTCLAYVAYAVLRQAFAKNALDYERKVLFENASADTKEKINEKTKEKKKYQKSGLGDKRRQNILTQLEQLLGVEKIHHDSGLNLSILCERLNASPQDVSQVINESDYENFYQMINRHRISDAQSLLIDREDLNVLQVAFEVGYSSKSTFNNAFKKFAGCSPSDYRARHLNPLVSKQVTA